MTNLSRVRSMIRRTIKDLFIRFSTSYSQAGQDYWVINEVFNQKRNGYFVDVGAYDGVTYSNTLLLERQYGWRGLCIEAAPGIFAKLISSRNVECRCLCLDLAAGSCHYVLNGTNSGIVGEDTCNHSTQGKKVVVLPTSTLFEALNAAQAPHEIDYLSIDIEGAETRVLRDFDFSKYRFTCITIERPDAELRRILHDNGYHLVKDLPELDAFFIHSTFIAQYYQNTLSFYAKKYFRLRWR